MKKISLSILVVFSSLVFCWGQNEMPIKVIFQGEEYWRYPDQDSTYQDTNYKSWPSGKFPKDGKWICLYMQDTTRAAYIFHVKDGLLEGSSSYFDFEGTKRDEYHYYKGLLDGYVRYWNKFGVLISEYLYRYNEKDTDLGYIFGISIGQHKNWHDNGNIRQIENYTNDGDQHGVQMEFHEDGSKKIEEFFHFNKRDSTYTFFHPNGQLKFQWTYQNGVFINESPYTEYHNNGAISGNGDMIEERKIGPWVYYHKNGQKKSEGVYDTVLGRHNHGGDYFAIKKGKWTYWHLNGNLLTEGEYDGMKEYSFSYPLYETPIATPKRTGTWIFYSPSGQVVTEEWLAERGIFINDK